jgi:hypothetical protein
MFPFPAVAVQAVVDMEALRTLSTGLAAPVGALENFEAPALPPGILELRKIIAAFGHTEPPHLSPNDCVQERKKEKGVRLGLFPLATMMIPRANADTEPQKLNLTPFFPAFSLITLFLPRPVT